MSYIPKSYELQLIKNENIGKLLTLSDNSAWKIDMQSAIKTSLWLISDNVKITLKNMVFYLNNLRTKDIVPAQYIEPEQ